MNNEKERLNALYKYAILDSEQEAAFDNIVQLASQICNTPVSLISLIDLERQWFKAKKGIDFSETSRSVSFCSHAILQQEVMMVKDATQDARFMNNQLVTGEPFIRFYAGAPLITPDGYHLGTLCVIDQQARELSEEQLFALKTLSQQVVSQLELRVKVMQLDSLVKTKNKILSVISHDVKGPLLNVRQLLSMFESELVSYEEMKLFSAEVLKRIDKTDRLLGDLINWFLSQVEGDVVSFSEVGLADLLQELIAENKEQLHKKRNKVDIHVAPSTKLVGDANMLKFIFRNILVNANKYTQKGLIRISAVEQGQHIKISIQDTGTGIEKSRLEKLYVKDKVRSAPGTANESGHGLGLLLAQDFVKKHEGKIEIFSELGVGTDIQVTLPQVKKDVFQPALQEK